MSTSSQSIAKTDNPFVAAFGISAILFVLLAAVFLYVLGVPLAGFALLWVAILNLNRRGEEGHAESKRAGCLGVSQ